MAAATPAMATALTVRPDDTMVIEEPVVEAAPPPPPVARLPAGVGAAPRQRNGAGLGWAAAGVVGLLVVALIAYGLSTRDTDDPPPTDTASPTTGAAAQSGGGATSATTAAGAQASTDNRVTYTDP